jgi:hypothetical protein
MIDEGEIYNDKGDYNTIINTRVLRMLPNLTEKQVQKIEAFEKKLKRIENMQKDFNRALE